MLLFEGFVGVRGLGGGGGKVGLEADFFPEAAGDGLLAAYALVGRFKDAEGLEGAEDATDVAEVLLLEVVNVEDYGGGGGLDLVEGGCDEFEEERVEERSDELE